jgi:hypothetical protein
VHEQGQTPDSLKRSYENAPLGQKWLKYAVFQSSENGLFPPFLLIVPFGELINSVSAALLVLGVFFKFAMC